MKFSLSCTKCGSSNIIKIQSIDSICINKKLLKSNLPFCSKLNSDKFICSSCGYTEYWLKSDKDLELSKKIKLAKDVIQTPYPKINPKIIILIYPFLIFITTLIISSLLS